VAASVDDSCGETFTAFKIRRKHKFVTFKIELETSKIVPDVMGAKKGTLEELKAVLPYTDCRYAVYDHEFTTADGRITDKLFFLSWMPHNATPYSKMAYASGKGMLRERLDGVIDTTCAALEQIEGAFGIGGGDGSGGEEDDEDDGDVDDW
jgi:cofilin